MNPSQVWVLVLSALLVGCVLGHLTRAWAQDRRSRARGRALVAAADRSPDRHEALAGTGALAGDEPHGPAGSLVVWPEDGVRIDVTRWAPAGTDPDHAPPEMAWRWTVVLEGHPQAPTSPGEPPTEVDFPVMLGNTSQSSLALTAALAWVSGNRDTIERARRGGRE